MPDLNFDPESLLAGRGDEAWTDLTNAPLVQREASLLSGLYASVVSVLALVGITLPQSVDNWVKAVVPAAAVVVVFGQALWTRRKVWSQHSVDAVVKAALITDPTDVAVVTTLPEPDSVPPRVAGDVVAQPHDDESELHGPEEA